MTSTTARSTTTGLRTDAPSGRTVRDPRGWAWTGVLAGAAGIAAIAASSGANAVYDPALAGDAEGIVAKLAEQTGAILAFHTATMVAVVALVVFAAGLRRRLGDQAPADSLLPQVAASGLALVSVAGLLGAGLTTEFVFGLQDPDGLVPETAVFFGHWIGTIPWLWVGAGLAALAVGVAGVRHAAVPRWLGWVSIVLGVLTTLVGMSPLQYLSGFVGPVWVLVAGLAFALGGRADRSAR